MNRLSLLITTAIILCASASARTIEDSISVNFRQSKTSLDSDYMDNAKSIDRVRRSIELFDSDSAFVKLLNVTVVGAASPEGSVSINRRLSEGRAKRIFNLFNNRHELSGLPADFIFVGRDWSGLRRLVTEDTAVPYRNDVIALLDDIIASNVGGERDASHNLSKLKSLHGGVPYIYMYQQLFPALRESKIILDLDCSRVSLAPLAPAYIATGFTCPAPALLPVSLPAAQRKPFYMALKTNMLYDAAALPNIGAEFYLGRNFSIAGDWMYGWWDNDSRHRYWRAYGGGLTLRRWFGAKAYEKPLTGHHVGVYAGVVTYDFELGGTGYMGGLPGRTLWDRCNFYAGAEYGYSLPVGRRFNIDFTIGVGWLGGKYCVYDPDGGCYVYKETRRLYWFGPTKAEISLVWLIGHGNYNDKKGGKR